MLNCRCSCCIDVYIIMYATVKSVPLFLVLYIIYVCIHTYVCNHFCYAVRLVDGPTEYEGRVEVYHNGEWGTVCDNGWDLNDAQVVCNELGGGRAIAAKHGSFYEKSSGNIWLDDVRCIGTELTIRSCSHNRWGSYNCGHSQEAGVQCTSGTFRF